MRDFNIYDTENLLKFYSIIDTMCKRIDNWINRIGYSYSNNSCGSLEVYTNISKEMERKSKYLVLKGFIEKNVCKLNSLRDGSRYRKVALILIHYSHISKYEMTQILEVKDRTLFRLISKVYKELTTIFNKSELKHIIINFIDTEPALVSKRREVENRRKAFYSTEEE